MITSDLMAMIAVRNSMANPFDLPYVPEPEPGTEDQAPEPIAKTKRASVASRFRQTMQSLHQIFYGPRSVPKKD
jgi:hypothetical protein